MEMSQGNSLCSYLKQKNVFFSFAKSQNERTEQVLSRGLVPVVGEDVGKGFRRVNIVQILCTHVCKWKNETC
jgi:hypothetical protein